MYDNFGLPILIIFLILLVVIFCTFFSSRLAQLKNRSRAWGLLGFFLNIPGLIIVCCLKSKRTDNMQTNPIAYAVSKIPSPSRKTIALLITLAVVTVATIIIYDNAPVMIQNYKYSKQILSQTASENEQPRLINAPLKEIFTGSDSTYALSEDGDVYCWGRQLLPAVDDKPRGVIYSGAKKVSASENSVFILNSDNELYYYGSNKHYKFTENEENNLTLVAKDVKDFSVSETTVGYIKTNGKLYMYGDNAYGQLGTYDREEKSQPEAVLGNAKKVICESTFTLVLQENGTAVAFGNSSYGQLSRQETAITAPVELHKNISDIAAGDNFVLLLKDNGELLACGDNSYGQLGTVSDAPTTDFVQVISDIKAVYAGKCSAFALSNNGELYAWGQNNLGQLGYGNRENVSAPEIVASNVKSASTSGLHTIILTNDGKIEACGYNSLKQLGKGSPRNDFEAVASVR